MKLVITGGHHSSALPVIKNLKRDHPDVEIFWVGHRHSLRNDKNDTLEYKEITSLGIPFYELQAGKLYKTFDLARLIKIPYGLLQSFFLLLKLKPDLILSFGGYLAAPVVFSGYLLGIPSITHEQTLVAGYANKFISHFAKKVLISWEESAKYFPKKKVKYVGIPLREDIFIVKSHSFDANNSLPYVYVTAGKTGSLIINQLIQGCLRDLLGICNVILQCGDYSEFDSFSEINKDYSKIKDSVAGKLFLRKFVLADEIGEAYSRATLIFARAGAHTVSEVLALHKHALLMPIPWVSHNEQNENALMLKNKGLGEIIDEKTVTQHAVYLKIKSMLEDLSTEPVSSMPSDLSNFQTRPVELIINEILRYSKEN